MSRGPYQDEISTLLCLGLMNVAVIDSPQGMDSDHGIWVYSSSMWGKTRKSLSPYIFIA